MGSPYKQASYSNHNPTDDRKLLLNKKEINKLIGKMQRDGLTLVPTKMYFKKGKSNMIKEQQKKVEIGTVKRQDILENQAKIVFLGIGSNLGIRKINIEKAKFLLAEHNLEVLSVSSYYETPSWPDTRKPKFLNIILKLKCYYSPQELLKICKFIENQLGRKKAKKKK